MATIRATAAAGSVMVLSTMSTTSLEAVAAACESLPSAPRWFQLYVLKDRAATRELVLRAERAGYSALVLTIDTPITGAREKDVRNKFTLPDGLSLANLQALGQPTSMDNSQGSGLTALFATQIDSGLTFEVRPLALSDDERTYTCTADSPPCPSACVDR